MKDMSNSTRFAVSVLALVTASPAVAQGDDVQVLADWDYSTLYASGWSVESMFSATEIISADGRRSVTSRTSSSATQERPWP